MSDPLPFLPPVSGTLEAVGFDSQHPLVRTAAPVVFRGNNLVLATPPAPGYALPALAAGLSRRETDARLLVLLAPEASLDAWVQAALPLVRAAGRRVVSGPTPARAAHHLAVGTPDLLITTVAVVSELLRRSGFDLGRLGLLIAAWPELEPNDEVFVPVFADLPKETPRVIVTADPGSIAPLVERYAWRAATAGPLGRPSDPAPAARQIRLASVGWDRRVSALAELVDLLDRSSLIVWTADGSTHEAISDRLAGHGVDLTLVTQHPPPAGFVVFYDAPPPELLARAGAEDAVVLAPPETEPYFARWIERPAPIPLAGPVDLVRRELAAERETIRARIEAGVDRAAVLTLAPLFERWSPTSVATALHGLWTAARERPGPIGPAGGTGRPAGAVARPKVWVNAGRKDGILIGEILSLLTLDLGFSRDQIGRVDLKETFTLIECDSELVAHELIDKLAGRTLKGRRLAARLDRGRDRDRPHRPAADHRPT